MAKRFDIPKVELKTLHTPEPTPTWSPVSHFDVVDQTEKALEAKGISVVDTRLDINGKGTYLFGTMRLDIGGDPATQFMLGFRNSTNKHLAVGYTAGLHVYVCSNMMFKGDYMTFKRHTSQLDLDMVFGLATEAIDSLPAYKGEMDNTFQKYSEVEVIDNTFKPLVFDLMKGGVLNPRNFNAFLKAMDEEIVIGNSPRTLASVHHGVTRMNREQSLEKIVDVTPRLTAITDDYYERIAV
jgi:hypothetical protein